MSVPTNLVPTRITQLVEYLGSSALGYTPYVLEGRTYKVQIAYLFSNALLSSANPQPLGPATGGVAVTASRADHVHPAVDLSDPSETQGALPLSRGGTGGSLSSSAGAVVYSTAGAFALSAVGTPGHVLTSNGSGPPTWAPGGGGSGTVTDVSVVSANGLAGTVATSTTTPAITLSTTITGLLKGNGTAISAAVASTDYLAPFGSQTANFFYAAPNGSAGAPSFRAIVAADVPTLNQSTTGSAATLTTGRTIGMTGDVVWTSPVFDGSGNVTAVGTIQSGVVTLAKMADLATARFIGRVTAGTGVPESITGAQATTLLDVFTSGLKGLAPSSGGGTSNYLRADGAWAAPPGTGGVSDGDKGDITVTSSGTVWTIDTNVVTFVKMQDIATDRLIGRDTAASGDPEEISVGGGLEFTGTGGIQRSALTGDVTASAGSSSTTIPNDTVTFAKMQNIDTSRIVGRLTAGTGDPEQLTGTQATTLLDTFTSVLKGLAPASGGGTSNFLRADGTWAAPAGTGGVSDGDKGDITVTGSGTVWTIDTNVVTFAKMQDIATARFVGRVTAATGDPEELTGTQATTLLDVFTSGLKGLAPSSGGGTSNFLRADGTWAPPAGGGDVAGPASATDNAIARFDSTTGKLLQNSVATVDDGGVIASATNSGANPVRVPLVNWVVLTANYNLTNGNIEQKAFNTTTNGALTLPTGVYRFKAFLYVTGMSATTGNMAFDPIGAGTAVADRFGYHASGIDNNAPLNAGTRTGSASVTQQSPASVVTAGTGTGVVAEINGMFRVSTAGTIIPSITLVTASAAVMQAAISGSRRWARALKLRWAIGRERGRTVGVPRQSAGWFPGLRGGRGGGTDQRDRVKGNNEGGRKWTRTK